MEEPFGPVGDEVLQGAPTLRVAHRGDDAARLVQGEVDEDSHYPTLPCSNAVVEGPRGHPSSDSHRLSWLILTSHLANCAENHLAKINRATLRKAAEERFRRDVLPTNEQIFPHDGFGTLIGKFIYNTVTTFFVGEKIMIQVPTYFFPLGPGRTPRMGG